jgi:hypothetical protein
MRRTVVLLAAMLATVLLIGAGQGPAHADVTTVKGSAYGYYLNVTLFGSAQPPVGPTPTVTLPASGSASPITATAPTGSATAGPATFFTSGPLNVSTQGTTGAPGSVTSSTNIQTVNTSGQEVFTAASTSSTCTASESGVTGSTTITSGTLQTDSGYDANGDGDYTDAGEHRPVNVTLPANPAPNTSYNGHIHVGSSTDNFRYVFNEQTVNPDGSITVNAAHEHLLGPTAVGDLIIGQSVCGVAPTAPPPDTTAPKVVGTAPKANATGIRPRANASAFFSEAMKVDSINTNTVKLFKKGSTTPIAAVVSYDASTKKAVLNPNANLKRGAKYKAVVTTGAKDLAGNQLDQNPTLSGNQPKQWFFTVRN